ncbi:MAG: DUF6807 family protein, partial [Pirellulaceae bacterium]
MFRAITFQHAIFAARVLVAVSLAFSFQHGQLNAQEPVLTFNLEINAGEVDRVNEIVKAEVAIDGLPAGTYVLADEKSGTEIIGQYDAAKMRKIALAADKVSAANQEKMPVTYGDISFVVPKLAAGESMKLTATALVDDYQKKGFHWSDNRKSEMELKHDDTSVAKLMYEKVDDSSPERRDETYKVYHHVFAPGSNVLLTKGAGGLFPHHRGIFYGYNRIAYGEDRKADVWHCKNGESQVSLFSHGDGGAVLGRSLSAIAWNGQDGNSFAMEQRVVDFIKVGDATVVDFDSDLSGLVPNLNLNGDPQHAGVQFRASQVVPDRTKHLTYYVRPDGKAKPGEFRNWSANDKKNEINMSHINLKWHAVCLALPNSEPTENEKLGEDDVTRYTICRIGSPNNPQPERFS